jgi:hypothetical protein
MLHPAWWWKVGNEASTYLPSYAVSTILQSLPNYTVVHVIILHNHYQTAQSLWNYTPYHIMQSAVLHAVSNCTPPYYTIYWTTVYHTTHYQVTSLPSCVVSTVLHSPPECTVPTNCTVYQTRQSIAFYTLQNCMVYQTAESLQLQGVTSGLIQVSECSTGVSSVSPMRGVWVVFNDSAAVCKCNTVHSYDQCGYHIVPCPAPCVAGVCQIFSVFVAVVPTWWRSVFARLLKHWHWSVF